jgi:hypothetical protein
MAAGGTGAADREAKARAIGPTRSEEGLQVCARATVMTDAEGTATSSA